ncbi:MAG: hypothetical protein ABIN24_08760 [Dyadobacter sp.]
MPQSVFSQIPKGFTVELFGPVEGFWSCELSNEDGTIKMKAYGDSADNSVRLCLAKISKRRVSKVAHLPTSISASRLSRLNLTIQSINNVK